MVSRGYHGSEQHILGGEMLLSSQNNPGVVVEHTATEDGERFDVLSFDTYTGATITGLFNQLTDTPAAQEADVLRGLRSTSYRDRRIERAAKQLKIISNLGLASLSARELIPVMKDSEDVHIYRTKTTVHSYRGARAESRQRLQAKKRQDFITFAHSIGIDIDELAIRRLGGSMSKRTEAKHGAHDIVGRYLDYLGPRAENDLAMAEFKEAFEGYSTLPGTDGGVEHEAFFHTTHIPHAAQPKTTHVSYRGAPDNPDAVTVNFHVIRPPHYSVPHLSWTKYPDGSRQLHVDAKPTYSIIERSIHHPSSALSLARIALATNQVEQITSRAQMLSSDMNYLRESSPRITSGLAAFALISEISLDNPFIEAYESAVTE